MATQIHAFGPNGELSPGAEAALEGLGGGGGGATALGDLTDVDTTGATTGQVLTFDGSEWSPDAPSAGTVTSTSISDSTATGRAVLTAADSATARAAIGAASGAQGAKADSAVQPTLIDAKGDLIVGTADNTVARLAAGTDGHVLTADSAQASGVKWAAAAGGGGGGFVFPIDATPLDPTYGDHFTGASLDAKWTRIGITAADEAYQQGANGSHLRVNLAGGAAFRGYTQPVPAGDVEAVVSFAQRSVTTTPPIFGLAFLASDDSGQGVFVYNNPMLLSGSINAGGAYSTLSGGIGGGLNTSAGTFEGQRIWLRVRRIGSTTDYASSLDGETWHVHHTRAAFTIAKVGIVRVFNSPATHAVHIDRFNMRSI